MRRDRVMRWILFGAGMLCGAEAGHLFYLDRAAAGGAFVALSAMFLFFSLAGDRGMRDEEELFVEERPESGEILTELGLFLADEALNGFKRIGRTMPPSPMEVAQLEDRLDALLVRLGAPAAERARLAEEFERIKGHARRNEGRRALSRSARL